MMNEKQMKVEARLKGNVHVNDDSMRSVARARELITRLEDAGYSGYRMTPDHAWLLCVEVYRRRHGLLFGYGLRVARLVIGSTGPITGYAYCEDRKEVERIAAIAGSVTDESVEIEWKPDNDLASIRNGIDLDFVAASIAGFVAGAVVSAFIVALVG